MADPNSPETPSPAEPPSLGKLAHKMNNAVAYVVTNLNALSEELDEVLSDSDEARRVLQLVDEASSGAELVGDLIRELKVLSWGDLGDEFLEDSLDDTWDETSRVQRLLVIDDEPYILASIRRALRRYDVVVADSGVSALERLRAGEGFDLVLCDLVMGHVSGVDVYRWIQAERPEMIERMIFMTAGAFTGQAREFLATVDNPVLHKPFDTKTLRWMIAQSLRRQPPA